jgi:hypothetical protein
MPAWMFDNNHLEVSKVLSVENETGKTEPKVGKPFTGTREHLAKMPPWRGGLTAEEIIREDRDSRP